MSVFRALFGRKRSVPFETTVHLSIPVDDLDVANLDDLDTEGFFASLQIQAAPGVSIERLEVTASLHGEDDEKDNDESYEEYENDLPK